jgi:hypothetical protein
MTVDRNVWIQERAYHLWLEAGRPHGTEQEHWYRAERELLQQESGLHEDSPATAASPVPAVDDSSGKSQTAAQTKAEPRAARSRPIASGSGSRGGRRFVGAKPAE